GQLFATTLVAEPNVCAALMGTLIKGLGVDHVCWGTDALWTGAPASRREEVMRPRHSGARQRVRAKRGPMTGSARARNPSGR
ncbi:amidohydrolase, partial [Bradyrhizobium sp. UFLA 03-164]|nr:amidohydrolase [Bradyrhizobium uaiense]